MTVVVNKRWSRYDVDITRRGQFGNKFVIGVHGDRPVVIAMHLEQWRTRLAGPDAAHWRAKLETLRGKRLGCVCRPQACHGDNYVRLLAEDR